jgi:16S rRNA (cytosine1402-N4)-methyltransferase
VSRTYHTPVLLNEALHFLVTDKHGVYVDGTLGGGGHSEAICKQLAPDGRLICFDADGDAIRFAAERLVAFSAHTTFVHSNFRNLNAELDVLGIDRMNGLLLDLGVSSFQLDEEAKGFSFRGDETIDMRMDQRQRLSGWDVVNTYSEEKLADVIWRYGEERNSRRIARRIVEAREIHSTGQLASTIESTVGKHFLVKTLARVFQAIRIEVNDELRALEETLSASIERLAVGGRVVVISYHSLEDRIVKTLFRQLSADKISSGHKYIPDTVLVPKLHTLTKSPVQASEEEAKRNPRARSAKMRVAERV